MKKRLRGSLLPSLFFLCGCISLPSADTKDQVPTSIYSLRPRGPETTGSAKAGKAALVIVVPRPEMPAGFETERIALYLDEGRRLDYYANAKWSGRLDDLIQDFIIQTTQHNLPEKVVATSDLAGSAQFRMIVKITDFQPVYHSAPDSAPRLDGAITVTLIALPEETVKTQFSLHESAPTGNNALTSITKGLETLLQTLTDQAVQKVAPYLKAP